MAMLELKVNGETLTLDIDPDTPLLWALRDHLQLHGTKYGCGIGQCGCCTVHVDDRSVRACQVKVSASRDWGRTARPCSRRGASWRCHSAAIASRA